MQLTVPVGDDGQLMSGGPPVLWLSTHAVQLTVPIGDDGQLMSSVQLTVPIGDDCQLMPLPLLRLLRSARPMA